MSWDCFLRRYSEHWQAEVGDYAYLTTTRQDWRRVR